MKAILQSIKPQYCELIAAGKKTIEIRKSKPKLETPFKVYIYQSTNQRKVIGEYVCEYVREYPYVEGEEVGEMYYDITTADGEATGLTYPEFAEYGKGKTLYGWHISNLVIYDKPKELSEFRKPCVVNPCINRSFCDKTSNYCCPQCMLTRPPQSWCYVQGI